MNFKKNHVVNDQVRNLNRKIKQVVIINKKYKKFK